MTERPTTSRPDLRLIGAIFILAVVYLVWRTVSGSAAAPLLSDTDDAMRMVQVRDFMGGQGWYDLVQHRLNTPFGAEIHWSRLVDVPIAALIVTLRLFLGAGLAETVAAYIWPLLLLGSLLWVSARLCFRLAGPDGVLPGVMLPLLSPAITAEFTPGRIDHHGVVIVLTLALAWTTIESLDQRRFAPIAGVLAATALAIATEALPAIGAAIVIFGMLWVLDGRRALQTRWFGLAFAGATALHLAIFRPPGRWLEAACDVLSSVHVIAAALVGLALVAATILPPPQRRLFRFVLLAGLGGAVLIALVLIFPQCLAGPYGAMDPWLQRNWLANIAEAKPWLASLVDLPAYTAAVGIPTLLATLLLGVRLWRVPADREGWAALLVFLLFTAVIMLAQVRGARLAVMPSIPVAARLISAARMQYLKRATPVSIGTLLLSWCAFSGVLISLAVASTVAAMPGRAQTVIKFRAEKSQCLLPGAFATLRDLPTGRIMAPIDLGAHILLNTQHAVVAAPYHRNQEGVLDAFRFFNNPLAQARYVVNKRGLDYLVICPAMPEVQGMNGRADDSMASLLQRNQLPDWLEELPSTGPLRIFAVVRPGA